MIMLVGVDLKWKSPGPSGYIFTNHATANEQATFIFDHIRLAHEFGINITAVVFDGLAANLACAEILGAKLDLENLQHWFPHPVTGEKVYVILDAVHMIKLARNLIGDKKELFIPGFDSPIKWDHYVALYDDQQAIGLKAGNKLSKIHIHYHRNKMKVFPAVQLLSTSVADSLQDCLTEGLNPRLKDCQATIYFTRSMDILFDFCNSRNPKAYGQKEAITLQNFLQKKKRNF